MAGQDDRQRIRPVRRSNGPAGTGTAKGAGRVAITTGFAERDRGKPMPDPHLKRRAAWPYRQVENAQLASEVSVKLPADCVEGPVIARPPVLRPKGLVSILEAEEMQCVGIARQQKGADRAVVIGKAQGRLDHASEGATQAGPAKAPGCNAIFTIALPLTLGDASPVPTLSL